MRRAIRINWNNQLEQIEPYVKGKGGVVVVTGGTTSALNTFIKLVRGELKGTNQQNLCVQLNPEDATTHTEYDIVVKLEQKLGVEGQVLASKINIASNIEAQGNVTISDIEIDYERDPYDIALEKLQSVERIIQKITERMRIGRVSLILFNWHKMPYKTVRWFWNELFDEDRLGKLFENGFLIVCAYETDGGGYPHADFLLTPECFIQLPNRFDATERSSALQDLADFLRAECNEDPQTAEIRADTLLSVWSDQPSQIHAGLPAQVLYFKSRR